MHNQSVLVSISFCEPVGKEDDDADGVAGADGIDCEDGIDRDDGRFLIGISDVERGINVSFSKSFVGTSTMIASFSFLLEFPLRRVNFPDRLPRGRNFFPKKKLFGEMQKKYCLVQENR